jgi:hypothetical protein
MQKQTTFDGRAVLREHPQQGALIHEAARESADGWVQRDDAREMRGGDGDRWTVCELVNTETQLVRDTVDRAGTRTGLVGNQALAQTVAEMTLSDEQRAAVEYVTTGTASTSSRPRRGPARRSRWAPCPPRANETGTRCSASRRRPGPAREAEGLRGRGELAHARERV